MVHQSSTDQIKKIELPSSIQYVLWTKQSAAVGAEVGLEVFTQFVGNNSEIKIEISDKSGKKFDTIKTKISGNHFWTEIIVPEKAKDELYAEVKLPKHGLQMKSGAMIVFPLIKVTNMKWGQKEARREDIVKLSADIDGLPNEIEVMILIYEYDRDGAHDFITKFPCRVKNKKIQAEWEYEYHDDTDEIPTDEEMKKYGNNYNPPEYFFVIDFHGQRFGDKQESKLLEFKDWIEIELKDRENEKSFANEEYILILPNGKERRGKLDEKGFAKEKDLPPGKIIVKFIKIMDLESIESDQWLASGSIEAEEDDHIDNENEITTELFDVANGIQWKTGDVLKIRSEPPIGRIATYLLDESGTAPLPNIAYELWLNDKLVINGETNDQGYLCHKNLLNDYYTLKICNEEYIIGTIGEEDEPRQICIIGKNYKWIDDYI